MIYLTGASGFVGTSILNYFGNNCICVSKRGEETKIGSSSVVIHLAGKAHDLKNTTTPDEYYQVNVEITKKIFDSFLNSEAKIFITLSSVKAIADEFEGILTEDHIPNPLTHYGKSKLLAEQYITSKEIPKGKRVFILRPCMIHGPGNKGNLKILYKLIIKGLPWPLGMFENSRSYLSIDNLCFVIKEIIDRDCIPSGVYNLSDDIPLSTNEVISLIVESKGKKARILYINKSFIKFISRLGDYLKLPLNSDRLQKLTENYIVSNAKIKKALGKSLPVSSRDGLKKSFQSFSENA